jgi:hypothetical protein
LPTSLIYILLSTRGCSPWRPAAVMSTTWRETNLPPVDFQGSSKALRTPQRCGALPAIKPYLRTNRFQGDRPSRRKENSSQGSRRRLHLRLRCRGSSTSKRRNVNRLPFREAMRKSAFVQSEPPYPLGSANPCPTAVHTEPFPTSVLKVLI